MNRIGILTTDTDLVVTTWDATLEQMTGIPADRARGHRLEEIVPDLRSRMLIDLIREPLISGSAQVLAPALHKYLIPCPPLEPSDEFDHMQQRVVVGALRDAHRSVGLVMSIEDVTERLERERELARQLRDQSPSARLKAVEQLAHEPADGIGPLGVAMGDEDWRVRRAAVKALAARRDEALVDGVIAALRDGHRDFSVLSSALQLLTLTGVDSTKALVRLMDDADADLRIQAALALGSQRHPEATGALLRALDDTDPNVRFHAIESLGKLASPVAIDKLAAIAESRDFYLAFPAIEALVRINDPLIAPRIAPLLGDPMLSAAAAEALGHIGDEDAIAPLVDALAAAGNLRRRRGRGADAHPASLRDVHVGRRRDQGARTPQALAGRYATHSRVARACLERICSSAHQRGRMASRSRGSVRPRQAARRRRGPPRCRRSIRARRIVRSTAAHRTAWCHRSRHETRRHRDAWTNRRPSRGRAARRPARRTQVRLVGRRRLRACTPRRPARLRAAAGFAG